MNGFTDLRAFKIFVANAVESARFYQQAIEGIQALVMSGVAVVSAAAVLGYMAGRRVTVPSPPVASRHVRRLTELPGLEEFPSISPDGRAVAFTASVDGRRQIFLRLLAGGAPLAITKDPADHQQPRWSPDGNSLVYFSPAGGDEGQGAIWAVPSLGGSPRRLLASISGADVSSSGRLMCYRLENRNIQLVTAALDGSDMRVVLPAAAGYHRYPRWSPDSRWIAFQRGDGVRDDVFLVAAGGGKVTQLTNDKSVISGLTWLPSGEGSSRAKIPRWWSIVIAPVSTFTTAASDVR